MKRSHLKFARSVCVAILTFVAIPLVSGGCSSPCTGITRWESARDVAFVTRTVGADFCTGKQKTQQHIADIPEAISQSFRDGAHRISGTQALYGGCYAKFQDGVAAPSAE